MRMALIDGTGSIVNLVEYDPTDERAAGFIERAAAAGFALKPIGDVATDTGGVTVEPGDRFDSKTAVFSKGTLGAKPVVFSAASIAEKS